MASTLLLVFLLEEFFVEALTNANMITGTIIVSSTATKMAPPALELFLLTFGTEPLRYAL